MTNYTTKYNIKHKPLSESEVEKLSQMEYHHAYSYIIAESLKRNTSCEYLWMSAIKLLAGVDQK